ncbi:cupin domain-containing protein [Synechococcus sp. MIT S1220]|uniref:cupin domain-containing protein n=1 Tax=Synechococcus sp. MIT S1220 TaxID=3082549 RepID=UPI0039AF1601
MSMRQFLASVIALAIFVLTPNIAMAEPVNVTEMFTSSTTIDGDAFKYPSGKAEMRLVRVAFEEGATFPMHTHATPLLGYIEKGQLTLAKKDGSSETFKQDESFILGPKTPAHTMGNSGDSDAIMWVTFAAAKGIPNLDLAS